MGQRCRCWASKAMPQHRRHPVLPVGAQCPIDVPRQGMHLLSGVGLGGCGDGDGAVQSAGQTWRRRWWPTPAGL
jgi:hypothetical protein